MGRESGERKGEEERRAEEGKAGGERGERREVCCGFAGSAAKMQRRLGCNSSRRCGGSGGRAPR